MIKISNGTKKGFKLKVPSTGHVRPKTGKTRKMIFDVLQSVDNYKILDLFAGCGSLGIEALSMGANFVTFIDSSPISIKYIKENLKKCTFEDSSDVQKKDFSVATRELMRKDVKFDLIFIDPPYDTSLLEYTLDYLKEHKFLRNNKYLYFERSKNDKTIYLKYIASTHNIVKDLSIGDVSYTIAINKNI